MEKYTSFADLKALAQDLKSGKVIAFPTDTVFGLACIYDDEKAIAKLKRLKRRDAHKPLPMMCADLKMVEAVAKLTPTALKLARHFWPGPLTMVLEKREQVPSFVTNGLKTIAIRIPAYEDILNLIKETGKALLVTSANIGGEAAMQKYSEVMKKLPDIDGIVTIDAQSLTASTIVDLSDDVKILRLGDISQADIDKAKE